MEAKNMINIEAFVNKAPDKVWALWTQPEHIVNWNNASPDWHTPSAENDLRPGGRFTSRMEARDGSMGFDFGGTYDDVLPFETISYTMDDGRKAIVEFAAEDHGTRVSSSFEPENQNSEELQRTGWQAILDNFKAYAEAQ